MVKQLLLKNIKSTMFNLYLIKLDVVDCWSVSVSVITPACHAGDGEFNSRTDRAYAFSGVNLDLAYE